MSKPILCLDFDGVIHQYTTPWTSSTVISDDIVDGFIEWANDAKEYFKLVIYSSRSKDATAIEAMKNWIVTQYKKSNFQIPDFIFASEKPPAFLTIDDRAIQFNGEWNNLCPKELLNFKPWNKR